MKKLSLSLLAIILITIFSCDKREDIFAENNVAPTLEVNTINTASSGIDDFTSAVNVLDSFNFNIQDYLINFRFEDESENVSFQYIVDNNATIEILSSSTIENGTNYLTEGVIKVIPTNVGLHNIDLIVTDVYNESKRVSIDLTVYLSNIVPALSISTVNNIGSINPTLSSINIIDTFSLSQGDIIIDYLLVDDNLAYNLSFNTTNAASIIEDLAQKNITNQTFSVAVTGQLKLTPSQQGLHDVSITITDDIGQATTLHAYIYIVDIPAVIRVNPGLNAFSSFNYLTSNFQSEVYLNQLGIYKLRYEIVDDSPTPNYTFTSSNSGIITENISFKSVSTIGGISTITGQLEITSTLTGIHTLDLIVTEPAGQIISSNKVDIRSNTNPVTNQSSLWLPFTNDLRLTYLGSDADASIFSDVITSYDVELYKNGNLVWSDSPVTGASSQVFSLTAYGAGTYYMRVRCHDNYGGISSWNTSNTVNN